MAVLLRIFTKQHISIILTVISTFCLACSVIAKRQYDGDLRKDLDKMKKENPAILEISDVHINIPLFRFGLFLIVIVAILQW